MPQHPVYTKLGINKYCIKNQHPGLSALICLLCVLDVFVYTVGKVHVLPELSLILSSGASTRPPPVHCLVFAQVMEVTWAVKLILFWLQCVRISNRKTQKCVCACACMGGRVPSVLLLYCHKFLSWENIASPNSLILLQQFIPFLIFNIYSILFWNNTFPPVKNINYKSISFRYLCSHFFCWYSI